MKPTPYIEDILSQPSALLDALEALDLSPLQPVRQKLLQGEIERVVITGMGASLYGSYPAWLLLARAGVPAYLVDAAELIYYAQGLITSRTLLWVISQSGRSAELLHLLSPGVLPQPKLLLALTNDLASPLAEAAGIALSINAKAEHTVSTRTYLNTLAISQLAALHLAGHDLQPGFVELKQAGQSLAQYLGGLQEQVEYLIENVGFPPNLLILARGPSLAAAHTGALVQAEASKYPAQALNAAEFRHGPLEIIHPNLTVMVLAGVDATIHLNQRMAIEIADLGGKVFWVASTPQPGLPFVQMPAGVGLGLPLVEIAPLQLLSLALAKQAGIEAGKFLFSGKVTLQE
jgi:glucosamine--fructose-6-phosphate aminotransferase (isomerizing)